MPDRHPSTVTCIVSLSSRPADLSGISVFRGQGAGKGRSPIAGSGIAMTAAQAVGSGSGAAARSGVERLGVGEAFEETNDRRRPVTAVPHRVHVQGRLRSRERHAAQPAAGGVLGPDLGGESDRAPDWTTTAVAVESSTSAAIRSRCPARCAAPATAS